MGGQACVLYGAAEFSRDCDIVVLADEANLNCLRAALAELQAECIAVPPFEPEFLVRGHAIHFRCQHIEAQGMRLDVMTKMRGCDDFPALWDRRTTLEDESGNVFELLSLEDLVQAKKTQRDKDWPMIRRLLESHYREHKDSPSDDLVRFWLRESRTPEMLIELGASYLNLLQEVRAKRPLLDEACTASRTAVRQALEKEESAIRAEDRSYWRPLVRELEALRRQRRNKP
jgi:hypothetical protein